MGATSYSVDCDKRKASLGINGAGSGSGSGKAAFDELPWGPWQSRTVLLAGVAKMTTAWHMASILFTGPDLPAGQFRCAHRLGSDAGGGAGPPHPWPNAWDVTWTLQQACNDDVLFNSSAFAAARAARACAQWEYVGEDGYAYRSVVTQWALVCERGVLVALTQFFYLLGIITGGALGTLLVPRLGPRRQLLLGLLVQALVGMLVAFCPLLPLHMLFRMALGATCALVFTAAPVLCADLCSGTAKQLTTGLFELWWAFGIMSLAGIGAVPAFADWSLMQLAMSAFSLALLLPCAWLLPESPRWLAARGDPDAAAREYARGAATNQLVDALPPADVLRSQLQQRANAALQDPSGEGEQSVWSLATLRSSSARQLIKVVTLHVVWACVVVSFFGGLLNARNLGATGVPAIARNVGACGLVGGIGFCIGAVLTMWSLRPLVWLGLFLLAGGSGCLAAHLVPSESAAQDVLFLLSALASRVPIAAAMPTLTACSGLLVPAPQRSSLLFNCLLFARVCLLGAPFVGNLVAYGSAYPLTVFGLLTLLAGIGCLLLAALEADMGPALKSPVQLVTIKPAHISHM